MRGTGHHDLLPGAEPRTAAAVEHYYGGRSLDEVAEGWRPFRTWASFLLRVARGRDGVEP